MKSILFRQPVRLCTLTLSVISLACSGAHAQIQLITNGNFETGKFNGWNLANQANPADPNNQDHFYISTPGSNTPVVNGNSFPTASNSLGGQYYAVTASDNPGAHALLQSFTVPINTTKLTLSYQMFVNDQSGFGPAIDPSGLDYTTGGAFNNNQQARVDILTGGASSLSTASIDVVKNFYDSVDSSNPAPYTSYSYNLTGLLTPGQSYQLRFAEVDNLGSINMGIDNVSISAFAPAVPEASSIIGLFSLMTISAASLRLGNRTISSKRLVNRNERI